MREGVSRPEWRCHENGDVFGDAFGRRDGGGVRKECVRRRREVMIALVYAPHRNDD